MASQIWVPSPRLRERLWTAAWATALAGALSIASWSLDLARGDEPGVTTERVLGLVALIPWFWIVGAYGAIGRELGRPSLGRGARSFVGAFFLFQVYDILAQPWENPAWELAVRVVFWIGLILLPILPFVSRIETFALAAAAVGLWVAQVVPAARTSYGAFYVLGVKWDAVGGAVVIFLNFIFLIWFATTKIRARRQLGGLAAAVGWAEITWMLLTVLGIVVGIGIAIAVTVSKGIDMDADDPFRGGLESQFNQFISVAGLIGELIITPLTIWLFLSLRSRPGAPALAEDIPTP